MATIVVGTNGSPSAQKAVDWTLGEARLRGAEVRLVHAWMVPLVDGVPPTCAPALTVVPSGRDNRGYEFTVRAFPTLRLMAAERESLSIVTRIALSRPLGARSR